jgi:hypothetical protein
MNYYENLHKKSKKQIMPAHYYGDTIRLIYVLAGVFMIFAFPFFASVLGLPILIPVIVILVLGIFAGLVSPEQKWVMRAYTVISVIGLIVFEYYAVATYNGSIRGAGPLFFWGNQLLALLFFMSTYLSVKTVRGVVFHK